MIFFYLKNEMVDREDYAVVVSVNENINSKDELFRVFLSFLKFPSYFGFNWDAFYDCLCSLEYLHGKKILILHEDVPFERCEEDRAAYLDILLDVEANLLKDNFYEIHIAFPIKCKDLIDNYEHY